MVYEIVMFLVVLKVEDTPDDVFLSIDRQVPCHMVFVLQYANRGRLLLNYKEWADADKTRFNILKTFRTEWMSLTEVQLELVGSTLDNIYETFAGLISGFGTTNAADTKQIMAFLISSTCFLEYKVATVILYCYPFLLLLLLILC